MKRNFWFLGSNLYGYMIYLVVFFFFQAEDGIRDLTVTGVQTCALPIFPAAAPLDRSYFQHARECRSLKRCVPGELPTRTPPPRGSLAVSQSPRSGTFGDRKSVV